MIRGWGFAAAVALIYASLLTCSHYWDGVLFSLTIERVYVGENPPVMLFHPNHLVYSALGYVLYVVFHSLHWRAISCLTLLNCVAGAAAAGVIFRWAWQITSSATLAWAGAILFAFGATWWKFSTDASAYVPAVLLVILSVRAALAGRATAAALLQTGAMLIHELAVFAVVPLAAALYLYSGQERWRRLARFGTLSAVLTSAAYLAVYFWDARPAGLSLWQWVTSYSAESKTTTTLLQVLETYPLSFGKLFLGGRLSLIRDFFSWPMAVGLALGIIFLVAAVILLRRRRGFDKQPQWAPGIVTVLWLWIAPYALFLVWFEPGNAFYKLFLWPPLVLLLCAYLSAHDGWQSRAGALLCFSIAVGCWNFAAFVYPHTQPASDPVYALALEIDRELPRNAAIYFRSFSPDDWYLAYFAPGRKWLPLPANLESSACLETTALSERQDLERPKKNWRLADGKHHVELSCF